MLETARADGCRVKVSLPKDPGQAGVHQVMALTRLLAGFVIVSSPESGSKEVRARPFAAQVNNGNVSLCEGGWVAAYRDELRAFPHGKYDDQVDASSRAFMELTASPGPMTACCGGGVRMRIVRSSRRPLRRRCRSPVR